MNNLAKTIKQVTGLSMAKFCAEELNTDYKAFNWRVKNDRLYPDEIFYMIWRTRKSIQELFGKSWHELIIDNSSGPVVARVKEIIGQMSKDDNAELERLLGFDKYQGRAAERHEVAPGPERPEWQKPSPPPPPEATPQAPETPPDPPEDDPLKKLFKNTY